MKKCILVILLLTTLQNINAQEPHGYSVLVGTNIPNFKTADLKATSGGPGAFVGVGFNMGHHESYNYQMEFAFVQNSVNFENSLSEKNKFELGGAIQVGLYLNYYIIKPDEDKFYFGPQAGIYTTFGGSSAVGGYSSTDVYEPSNLGANDISNSSKFNYGSGLGLTGAYNKFRFNLRYNLGLSNLFRTITLASEPGSYPSDVRPYSGKLSSISLTVSYRFFSKN